MMLLSDHYLLTKILLNYIAIICAIAEALVVIYRWYLKKIIYANWMCKLDR